MTEPSIETQRIDKWIWHARVVKTRSLAQKLIASGKVRVDRDRTTSASHKLKAGNVLTIAINDSIKVLEVVAFADKRGAYEKAQTLYKDLSPPKPTKIKSKQEIPNTASIERLGKPGKQERRKAIQLKRISTEE